MRGPLTRLLARWPYWAVSCPDCARPGRRCGRVEAGLLVATHNGLLHRGRPVAAPRLVLGASR